MGILVVPDSKVNRQLAMAVRKLDVGKVCAALEAGADPDTFLTTYRTPVLVHAATMAHTHAQAGESTAAADGVVAALLEHGANLVRQVVDGNGRVLSAAAQYPLVREHPTLGPLAVEHARKAWEGGLGEDQMAAFLTSLTGTGPVDEALRDLLATEATDQQTISRWQKVALTSPTTALVAYCHAHGMPLSTDFVHTALSHRVAQKMASAAAVAWWLGTLDPSDRAAALVGAGGRGGMLETAERECQESVRTALWEGALGCQATVERMLDADGAGAFAVLAVRQEPKVALGFIEHAQAGGVDLSAVRADQAKDRFSSAFDPGAWRRADTYPPGAAGLLSCHLRRPHGLVAVGVCRQLMRAGVEPAFEDLCSLAAAMTYLGNEVRLGKLYREWVEGGVDPAPEGMPPAWTHARLEGTRGRLEAWSRARDLDRALERAQANPAGPRRRM